MRLVFLAAVLLSSFWVGDVLALSPEMQELGERLEAINREAERLAEERAALESSFWLTAPGQVVGFALLVVGIAFTVIWIALPFMVNGIRKNIKAMRLEQEEERLAAASQRAAQLGQLKIIAHALSGGQVPPQVEEAQSPRRPLLGPDKVRFSRGRE